MSGPDPDQTDKQAATDDELARSEDGVDRSWYLKVNADVAAAGTDPVDHYLRFGWREGRDPRPDFSATGYLKLHEDVARTPQNPLIHYLRHRQLEGAPHDPPPTEWYLLWKKGLLYPKTGSPPPQSAQPYGTSGRQKFLFTGHDAGRSGAQLILLALMEAFDRLTGAELFLVLEREGPLLDQFRRVAHVLVNQNGVLYTPQGRSMRRLLNAIAAPAPGVAVCNCAESWRLMQELRYADLPHVVALVHGRVAFYSDEACQVLHRGADRIVFPAEAVKTAAVRDFPQFRDALVAPQGLLKPAFGQGDKNAARREVREELGLPANTRIVFNCGTRDTRKGLDLFVQLAARVTSQTAMPVHFVWLGGDDRQTEFTKFVQHDLTLLKLRSRVSLVTETADPERYFLAADVFCLTSRDDPFPCVVHEAMACALPVVVFDDAGGAGQAVAGGCGMVVPYLDIDGMARLINAVLERPSDFTAMGEMAARRVRSVYRFADYAQRFLDVCNELQARTSRSPSLHSPES